MVISAVSVLDVVCGSLLWFRSLQPKNRNVGSRAIELPTNEAERIDLETHEKIANSEPIYELGGAEIETT